MSAVEEPLQRLSGARRELAELWLAADGTAETASPAYAPPRTDAERVLAGIWADALDADRVGIDDDYFALGGDSILAIVIVARSQRAGLSVTTQDLFELPTIRGLAARVTATEPPRPAATDPAGVDPAGVDPGPEVLALTPLQAGILFHALDDPAAYLVQITCDLVGDVDAGGLALAWQQVVARHPALRVGFRWGADGAGQVVHAHAVVPLVATDLRGDPVADQDAAIAHYVRRDRERGLPPDRPPLLRMALFRRSDDRVHCVLTHHHLLLDGWSQQLLLAELLAAYDRLGDGGAAATETGPAPSVPPAPRAYLDWLANQSLDAARRFWQERLHGFVPRPPAGVGTVCPPGRYRTLEHLVPAPTAAALDAYARRHRLTIGTLVQAGWALLLARASGSTDVAFGLTLSGRPAELPGATEALGLFINTLPARVAVADHESLRDWLGRIQQDGRALDRYGYTPLPVVEQCRTDGGTEPLFRSLVVIENFPTTVDDGYRSRRLRVERVHGTIEEGYPLVVEARPGPSRPLRLRLRYNRAAVPDPVAAELHNGLVDCLDLLAADPPGTVGELAGRIAARQAGRATAEQAGRMRAARRQPITAAGGERDG